MTSVDLSLLCSEGNRIIKPHVTCTISPYIISFRNKSFNCSCSPKEKCGPPPCLIWVLRRIVLVPNVMRVSGPQNLAVMEYRQRKGYLMRLRFACSMFVIVFASRCYVCVPGKIFWRLIIEWFLFQFYERGFNLVSKSHASSPQPQLV